MPSRERSPRPRKGDEHILSSSNAESRGNGGVVAWWRGGVVAWWRGGVVAWWRGGVVAWWRGGVVAVVAWWGGGVVGGWRLTFPSSSKAESRRLCRPSSAPRRWTHHPTAGLQPSSAPSPPPRPPSAPTGAATGGPRGRGGTPKAASLPMAPWPAPGMPAEDRLPCQGFWGPGAKGSMPRARLSCTSHTRACQPMGKGVGTQLRDARSKGVTERTARMGV